MLTTAFSPNGGTRLTVLYGSHFGISGQRRWASNTSWQPGYNTLSVIHCENEGSVETPFLFLITCDQHGIRAKLNNPSTKGIETKLDAAGIVL